MYSRHILEFMEAELANAEAILVIFNKDISINITACDEPLRKMRDSFEKYKRGLEEEERNDNA